MCGCIAAAAPSTKTAAVISSAYGDRAIAMCAALQLHPDRNTYTRQCSSADACMQPWHILCMHAQACRARHALPACMGAS